MTEIELVELLRTYGGDSDTEGSLAWLAQVIRYLAAVGSDDARSSLSVAQAESLDATSDGVNALADAIESQHPGA